MIRIEVLIFKPSGNVIDIRLETILRDLFLLNSNFEIIKFDRKEHLLVVETEDFYFVFPEQRNRFSISTSPEYLLSLLEIVNKNSTEDLLVSTPGYETFMSTKASKEEIFEMFGLK